MSKATPLEIISTAGTMIGFITELAEHLHHGAPEPAGLSALPSVTQSAIATERMRIRMEKAEKARVPGSGV